MNNRKDGFIIFLIIIILIAVLVWIAKEFSKMRTEASLHPDSFPMQININRHTS